MRILINITNFFSHFVQSVYKTNPAVRVRDGAKRELYICDIMQNKDFSIIYKSGYFTLRKRPNSALLKVCVKRERADRKPFEVKYFP